MVLSSLLAVALTAQPSLTPLRTQYLDGLFRARPHMATFMGDHRFDGQVMDLSDAAVQRRLKELTALSKRLSALDRSKLSADDRADAEILAEGIALEELYLQDLREWTWDPRLIDSFPFYDPREYVASRLGELVHGTFANEAQRRKWVTEELNALPRLLQQQEHALVTPSRVHLDKAVKDNKGRIAFFNTELKEFTAKDPKAEKARLQAVAALEKFQQFLEQFPREKATHDWRLGKALYAKKFPLALQTDATPEQLATRADAAFRASRDQLYAIALRLHAELWPKEQQPAKNADPKAQAAVIRRVQEEISKDHPTAENFVQAHADKLDGLREFITEKNLLTLPPKDTLVVMPEPEFKRGATGAEYLSPGMLDKSSAWHGTFYVDPVDPTWPAEKQESYLRANNNYEITLTSAHEAYPGHHTQAWYARKDLNPLRATLWSGAFAEGWAVYGEHLLVTVGLGAERNDRFAFLDTKGAMIVAANALLDIKLQSGEMTDEQALHFMEDEGFQEAAQAERKLLRAKLDSTQLCQYFLGDVEILDLEKDVRAKGNFDQRRFNESLISHGTAPVKVLRSFLLPATSM